MLSLNPRSFMYNGSIGNSAAPQQNIHHMVEESAAVLLGSA